MFSVTREGFPEVVNNAFTSLGFPPQVAMYVFPDALFRAGSDLTPIEANIDKIIDGLTKWEPEIKEKGVITPPKATVEGKDYEEAVANMNLLFLSNLWGDGLPILPPTEERVNWLLTGTDLPRDTVIGKILPKNAMASVETIAINAAMAGARPEYMPVIVAIVKAMLDPAFGLSHMNVTTGDSGVVVIVNGPVAKQIRINSGYGCMGPSSEYPAGGSIGRAIRLILINVGGGIPGKGSMSLYGPESRYTNIVFAEDEDGVPPDWVPFNVEQGFARGSNTVAVTRTGTGVIIHGARLGVVSTEVQTVGDLNAIAKSMAIWGGGYAFGPFGRPDASPGMVLFGRGLARDLSDLGWSKEDVKTYLWENSKIPKSEWLERHVEYWVEQNPELEKYVEYPIPLSARPETTMIVVAGGEQSGHHRYLKCGTPVTIEIELPANWEGLLKEAEEDLGPPPAF